MKKNQLGFSLVELVMTLGIVGGAGLLISNQLSSTQKVEKGANNSQAINLVHGQIQSALNDRANCTVTLQNLLSPNPKAIYRGIADPLDYNAAPMVFNDPTTTGDDPLFREGQQIGSSSITLQKIELVSSASQSAVKITYKLGKTAKISGTDSFIREIPINRTGNTCETERSDADVQIRQEACHTMNGVWTGSRCNYANLPKCIIAENSCASPYELMSEILVADGPNTIKKLQKCCRDSGAPRAPAGAPSTVYMCETAPGMDPTGCDICHNIGSDPGADCPICPTTGEPGVCSPPPPPPPDVNGGWSDWSDWSCLDTATEQRSRSCTNPSPSGNGTDCSGSPTEPRTAVGSTCSGGGTQINGGWSPWGDWSACVNGAQTRTRTCDSPPPANGGSPCPDTSLDSQTCVVACTGYPDGKMCVSQADCGNCCNPPASASCADCSHGGTCGGSCRPNLNVQLCEQNCTPSNGEWSDWSNWGLTEYNGSRLGRNRYCSAATCGGTQSCSPADTSEWEYNQCGAGGSGCTPNGVQGGCEDCCSGYSAVHSNGEQQQYQCN